MIEFNRLFCSCEKRVTGAEYPMLFIIRPDMRRCVSVIDSLWGRILFAMESACSSLTSNS